MELCKFIQENMEAILQEWELFARSLPPGMDLDVDALRDHARQILETIADDMGQAQTGEESERRSKGKGGTKKLALEYAQQHASTRLEEGFDINQLVSEYRALRASVIRLWGRQGHSTANGDLDDLTRFNEEIDQALTYSVRQYSQQVDQTRQTILSELRESDERHRALAHALLEGDQRKDEFLATLAHELRNPLSPIQTGIEILRLTESLSSAAQEPLHMMERQMQHLVRLVDDLLDISRINQGKVTLRLEKVDLRGTINKAVEATASYLYAGNRQVKIDLPPHPLVVNGDAVRLVQIVGNLLSNAGKHTDENGHIRIVAERDGQHARIRVLDDGIGIAPDKLGNLFQMFMQVDVTRREGLGIGLALVRNLVELHGGTVEAASEGLGTGSEFVVCLPLLDNGQEMAAPGPAANALRLQGLRVLVVDDNRDAAASLTQLLKLLGAEVHAVHAGAAALALVEELLPDIVLLDIGLPGMDGYEVARRIRKFPLGRDIRIVAVTGWGQEEDRRKSLQAGFNDHLVKPINMRSLEKVMGRVRTLG